MSAHLKILPVYGEGDRAAVEGVRRFTQFGSFPQPPSVAPSGRHLPVNGEDL